MLFKILQIAIPFIWFGMIGAISFMETPLKFQAPNITLGLGLGISRLLFHVFNKIELVFAVVLTVSIFVKRPKGAFAVGAVGVIVILLLLETLWILPLLDVRAEEIINGGTNPYSVIHVIYIGFDAAKFVLLLILGTFLTKQAIVAGKK